MEHVVLKTSPDGSPVALIRDGREWLIGAEPLRWYERVNWWEQERRMPRGAGRVDVEILRLQAQPDGNDASDLVTMELVRDAREGSWRLRNEFAAAA